MNRKTDSLSATGAALPVHGAEAKALGLCPADRVLLVFTLFLLVMLLAKPTAVMQAGLLAALLGALGLLILLLSRISCPRPGTPTGFIRLWYPVAVVPLLFTALGRIVSVHSAFDGDALLKRIDLACFGGHPAVALQRLHHPFLTEFLQLVYSSFYFMPLAIGVALVLGRRWADFDYFVFLISYGFCFSYLGYFLIPAIGPAFGLHDRFAAPLQGSWLFSDLAALQARLESVHRDCFPSGHTMMTLVFVHYAFRQVRPLFYVLLPLGSALIFSTLYLRYHYGIDLLAGVVFYLFLLFSAPALYRLLSPRPKGAAPSG